jgi:hypothetical protein
MTIRALVAILIMVLVSNANAQSQVAGQGRTVSGATAFVTEMITRAPAEVKPWPGFIRSSPVVAVTAKQPCQIKITLADKSAHLIDLSRALGIKASISSNPPQSFVEITGGVQSFKGVDIYVGDTPSVRRVSEALEFIRSSCDKSTASGF